MEKRHNYVRKVAETAVQLFITNDRVFSYFIKIRFLNVNPLMSPKKIRLLNLKINITLKIAVVVGVIAIVRCC